MFSSFCRFLLLLGRDNADQDWAIDNNSLIGKTVRLSDLSSEQDKAVRIDPTGIRFFQVRHNVFLSLQERLHNLCFNV